MLTMRLNNKRGSIRKYSIRIFWVIVFFIFVTTTFWLTEQALSANETGGEKALASHVKPTPTPVPQETPVSAPSGRNEASRLTVTVGEKKDFPFRSELKSALVVSPEIAGVQIKNAHTLTVSALKIGETILLVSDNIQLLTLIVQVEPKPSHTERKNDNLAAKREPARPVMTGSYNVGFSAGMNGSPSVIRQRVDVQRKISNDKTLRISGEIFKSIGGEQDRSFFAAEAFAVNRVSFGIDTKDKTIDFLDSQINLSPLSFNGYTMRGFHYAATPRSATNSGLPNRDIEIFAGLSRPSRTIYDNTQGSILGVMLPFFRRDSWELRGGVIRISPEENNRIGQGGTVLQLIGNYAPNDRFSAAGEIGYANHEVSWRARVDVKFREFGAYGEVIRLDKKSPFSSIGAQSGGNRTEAMAVYWRPASRLNASFTYNHSLIGRLHSTGLIDFERTNLAINTNYKISRNSRLNFRFLEQDIETAVSGSPAKIKLENRSFIVGNNTRFNENWSNIVEARFNFSREADAKAELENGFDLREQLRFSFGRTSLTGFLNYTYKTPSLTGLIIRNPQILPPVLREAFTLDPTAFVQLYQDRLAELLPTLDLPMTRSLETGITFQTNFSRFTLMGESRYLRGEVLSQNQKAILNSVGVNIRLDQANYLQINGWKSTGVNSRSALSFSYTHVFGQESGENFTFAKLFGLDRGKIQGRVFYDLNNNGQDDPDEPGVSGITIQLNEKRTVQTDFFGRYSFSVREGVSRLTMISDDLGHKWRATNPTDVRVALSRRETQKVSFGLINTGTISGQILNDLRVSEDEKGKNLPGIRGVKMKLRRIGPAVAQNIAESYSATNGVYEFANLSPGEYVLELDPSTLPPNFKLPEKTAWQFTIEPLRRIYFDVLLLAQRSVTGIVFVDKNANGTFEPEIDEPVAGSVITAVEQSVSSDVRGMYILRNLPAGKIKLTARLPEHSGGVSATVELGPDPLTRRGVNFSIKR